MCVGAPGSQGLEGADPLELESQGVVSYQVWVLSVHSGTCACVHECMCVLMSL